MAEAELTSTRAQWSSPQAPAALDAAEPGRGRLARTPAEIPHKGWRDIAWRSWRGITADRLPSVAAGITFYALLAVFPAIGVFVSLYGLIADLEMVENQLRQLAAVFPADVLDIIAAQMIRLSTERPDSLSLAFAINLTLSVWSANAGTRALFYGLDVAYGETEKRSYVRVTGSTLTLTLAAMVFVGLIATLLAAVPLALDVTGLDGITWLLEPLRWVLMLLLSAGFFCLLYRFGPSRTAPRWRWTGVGGALAAGLWLAGSLAFSWYVNNLAHYDITYGSLGAVIAFMVWIWFSAMAVLLGAEINAEIEHQTACDSTVGPAKPMGRRGAYMADTVGEAFHGSLWSALPGRNSLSPPPPAKRAARPDPPRSGAR